MKHKAAASFYLLSALLGLLFSPKFSVDATTKALDLQAATWEKVVFSAADVAVRAIAKQTGAELSLRDVPLETLQIFAGQQHHLGISIDGFAYEIALGGEKEFAAAAAGRQALPQGTGSPAQSTQLALERHWQQQQEQASPSALTLPDVTLSGPLELVLQEAGLVSFFVPHAADVGVLRRIRLGPGVTVKVAGLKSITLRRPTELPTLPIGYLVEVYAQAQLGVPEEGYNTAPGLHYLAEQLHRLALNSTSLPLLSFEVAQSGPPLTITSATTSPGPASPSERPPRLKIKRAKDGSVELSLPQVPAKRTGKGSASADLANMGRLWAWPLPHVDLSALVPYETLLRSILAAHPFDLSQVQAHGISVQLTKSEIQGVRMLGFEMEVRSRIPRAPSADPEDTGEGDEEDEETFAEDQEQLMVFDVVMQVVENDKAGQGVGAGGKRNSATAGDWSFVPMLVKLKQVHGSTVTMSSSAVAALLGNDTSVAMPTGYESYDFGVAGQADEQ